MGRHRRRSRPGKGAASRTRPNVKPSIAPARERTCPHGKPLGYRVDLERSLASLVLDQLAGELRTGLARIVMHVMEFPTDIYTPDQFIEILQALHRAGMLPIVGGRAMLPTPGMFGLTQDQALACALEAEERIRAARRAG
jgi:hypothetical protein